MKDSNLIPEEVIQEQIYSIRKLCVMLDSDLAKLYDLETKHLKRQVRGHTDRFPNDFILEL